MWSLNRPHNICRSCDLNFMVRWFLPYILKTIQRITFLLGKLAPCDTKLESKIYMIHVTYISWSIDFALYLEHFLINKKKIILWTSPPWDTKNNLIELHTWDIVSLLHQVDVVICLSHLTKIYGPVILPYIMKTARWMNFLPLILWKPRQGAKQASYSVLRQLFSNFYHRLKCK